MTAPDSLAAIAGQVVTVALVILGIPFFLWKGYQSEHPKGSQGGEMRVWGDEPDWPALHAIAHEQETPAERANAPTGAGGTVPR